jgi:putative transposase
MGMPMDEKPEPRVGPPPALPEGLLGNPVKGPMTLTQIKDLMLALNKAVIECARDAKMNLHLDYLSGKVKPNRQTNERNGAKR